MNKRKQYRRLLSLALALLLAMGLLSCAAADGMVGYYVSPTSSSVNYYTLGGSVLSSLGLLSTNSAYLVTGSEDVLGETYYEISVNGGSAYVKAANVQIASTASQTGETVVTTAAATQAASSDSPIGTVQITPAGTTNMRSEPHMTGGNIIAQIKKGTTLALYGSVVPPSGNHVWYYCYDEATQQFGYVLDDCAKVTSLAEGASLAQLPSGGGAVSAPVSDTGVGNSTALGYVRITPSGKTNIRKTAKSDVKNVVAQAEQGSVLPYYAVSVVDGATWYYVYYQPDNAFGYVQGKCAEITTEKAAATAASVPSSASTAFTNVQQGTLQFTAGGVNLRKSASENAKVIGHFDKDEITAYYGVTYAGGHTWYQVQKDELIGYVMGDFVQQLTANGGSTATAGTSASAAQPTVTGYVRTTADKVLVRKKPNTNVSTYGTVQNAGTVLPMTGSPELVDGIIWYPVQYEGKDGFIHGSYAAVMTAEQITAYQNGQPIPEATATNAVVASSTKEVDYIQTIADKVWIRSTPSTGAKTKGQALLGAVFHFTGTTHVGGSLWYAIDYGGDTCYIKGKFCKVMTEAEYAAYKSQNQNSSTGNNYATGAIVPSGDLSNIALTAIGKVIVRAEGNAKGKQVGLLYRSGQMCTLLGDTNQSDGYTWYHVSVNGITGWIRGDLLNILTKAEAEAYNNGNNGNNGNNNGGNNGGGTIVDGVTLYKPELIDWNNGGIQRIFGKGETAYVTDVKKGISFKVRRWSGGDHADVEPCTAADTAAMCTIYGVRNAQEINDKNLYQRRPILVTLKGHSYAASMYGVPHNYPDGDTISNNNFNGQFCIHFLNSRVHKSNKVDADHQAAIMYAYNNAAKLLGIK